MALYPLDDNNSGSDQTSENSALMGDMINEESTIARLFGLQRYCFFLNYARKYIKCVLFLQKNLVMSKKSSNFAVRFEPLAIELDGLRVTGYRLRDPLE